MDRPTEQMATAITQVVMRDARRYAFAQLLPHLDAAAVTFGEGPMRLTGEIALALDLDATYFAEPARAG